MSDSPNTPRPPRTRSRAREEKALTAVDESTPRAPAPPVQAGGPKHTGRRRLFALPSNRRSESPSDTNTSKVPGSQNLKASFPSSDSPPVVALDPALVDGPPTSASPPIPLIDFLRIPPPSIPDIYAPGKLTSTKAVPNVSTLDIVLKDHERLLSVVPFLDMMEPLIAHVQAKYGHIKLDPGLVEHRDWILSIHPAIASTFLPSVIHSESDTEDWVLNVLWRPALAAYWAAEHNDFSRMGKFPNLTSCSGGGTAVSLPDVMLWEGTERELTEPDRVLKATVEIKTHAAFVDMTSANKPTFEHLLQALSLSEVPPGYGVRFVWNESDDETMTEKADKMIAQVWIQMVQHNMRIAALTNYNSVIFFVRDGQTLYMSGEHTRANNIFLAIFAFIAYALGSIPADTLELPVETKEWWNNVRRAGTAEAPGLDRTTLPERLFEYLAELKLAAK
ncbi:hypothetical protein B0H11DRAFT_1319664 [Mycena galericulata]|nr:hypothetical protein B0H11DRAFT_1319664 [Mycena galericulata]